MSAVSYKAGLIHLQFLDWNMHLNLQLEVKQPFSIIKNILKTNQQSTYETM